MRYFKLEDFTDYIYKDGEKIEFNPRNFYRFHSDDDNKCIIPRDCNNGHIVSKKEIYSLTLGLIEFLKICEQTDIDEFNGEIDMKNKKQIQEEMQSLSETKKSKQKPGYVYFIQDNMGNTKIGLSKNLGSRFKTYTEMPYDPEMIHHIYCSDMVIVEEYFHKLFDVKRFKGEWFKLNEQDIKFIKSNDYGDEIMPLIITTSKKAL